MHILVRGEKLFLFKLGGNYHRAAALPGARWSKANQALVLPLTPTCVARFLMEFGPHTALGHRTLSWHSPEQEFLDRAAWVLGVPGGMHFSGSVDIERESRRAFREKLDTFLDTRGASRWKAVPNSTLEEALGHSTVSTTNSLGWDCVTPPWIHQRRVGLFVQGMLSYYIAAVMGAGKTLNVIQKILLHQLRQEPTLILCPKKVVSVWEEQIAEHAPGLLRYVVTLNQKSTAAKLNTLSVKGDNNSIVICNYDSAWRAKLGKEISKHEWGHVVCDEAHRIKAATSSISKWVYKLKAHYRGCVSGTPFPNNRLDAFGQYRFLDPGVFGYSISRMKKHYCIMGGYQNYEIKDWKNTAEFDELVDLYMIRVPKEILNLPPVVHMNRYGDLDGAAATVYRDLHKKFVADVHGGLIVASNAAARLTKLREVCSGFVYDENGTTHRLHDAKADLLEEILDEIGDKPVVVFCEFREEFNAVRRLCEKLGKVYGEVSGQHEDLDGYHYPAGVQVLGVHPKSGGLGVDLTKSHHGVFFSLGFNWGDHEQAKGRLDRKGQNESVRFIYLLMRDTVERQVLGALNQKADVSQWIMDYVLRRRK